MKALLLNNSIILCMDIVFLLFLGEKKEYFPGIILIKGKKGIQWG